LSDKEVGNRVERSVTESPPPRFGLCILVLSCLVLAWLVLSRLALPCLVLLCLVLSCLFLSCFTLSCFALPSLILSCLALPCPVLSCRKRDMAVFMFGSCACFSPWYNPQCLARRSNWIRATGKRHSWLQLKTTWALYQVVRVTNNLTAGFCIAL
jgi:hypothetical protein